MIRGRRQNVIDEANRRENLRRQFKDYNIGDKVMIKLKGKGKLNTRFEGPYTITIVHINGTVTIARNNNTTERINIRRLHPYNG